MRVGNFSVQVQEGRERDTGHVCLEHNRQYTIKLGNHNYGKRCDAEVVVDGKEVGSFRINAGHTMLLERPAHDTGRFTFFKADSTQADAAGVTSIGTEQRGIIRVTFRPERQTFREAEVKTSGILRSMGFNADAGPQCRSFGGQQSNVSPGITGLTGQSSQEFVNVSALDYDPSAETVITLRLVTDNFAVRELTSSPRSNPVPAAV